MVKKFNLPTPKLPKNQFTPPKIAKKSVYTPQNAPKIFYPTQKKIFWNLGGGIYFSTLNSAKIYTYVEKFVSDLMQQFIWIQPKPKHIWEILLEFLDDVKGEI